MKGPLASFQRMADRIEMSVSIALFILMTAALSLQVISRYLFVPLSWPEELATIASIWMAFLGTSYALKYNRHLALTYFVERLPKRFVALAKGLTDTILLAFVLSVFFSCARLQGLSSRSRTVALRIPSNCYTIPLLLACAGMAVFLISNVVRRAAVSGRAKGGEQC